MLSERIYKGYEASLAEIEAHPAVTAVAAGTTGEGRWGRRRGRARWRSSPPTSRSWRETDQAGRG